VRHVGAGWAGGEGRRSTRRLACPSTRAGRGRGGRVEVVVDDDLPAFSSLASSSATLSAVVCEKLRMRITPTLLLPWKVKGRREIVSRVKWNRSSKGQAAYLMQP
jgi:hypothetical protein